MGWEGREGEVKSKVRKKDGRGNRASGYGQHLIEDLQHIKVPIGIELVACVVAGNGHRDGMAAQLMQQGDPPPPWGALPPLIPVLHRLTHMMLKEQCNMRGCPKPCLCAVGLAPDTWRQTLALVCDMALLRRQALLSGHLERPKGAGNISFYLYNILYILCYDSIYIFCHRCEIAIYECVRGIMLSLTFQDRLLAHLANHPMQYTNLAPWRCRLTCLAMQILMQTHIHPDTCNCAYPVV